MKKIYVVLIAIVVSFLSRFLLNDWFTLSLIVWVFIAVMIGRLSRHGKNEIMNESLFLFTIFLVYFVSGSGGGNGLISILKYFPLAVVFSLFATSTVIAGIWLSKHKEAWFGNNHRFLR